MSQETLFVGLALVYFNIGAYAYVMWGWKRALAVLAGGPLVLVVLFLLKRRGSAPIIPPPPPPPGAGVAVGTVAGDVVKAASEGERATIAAAANDPDALAEQMRNQR